MALPFEGHVEEEFRYTELFLPPAKEND